MTLSLSQKLHRYLKRYEFISLTRLRSISDADCYMSKINNRPRDVEEADKILNAAGVEFPVFEMGGAKIHRRGSWVGLNCKARCADVQTFLGCADARS